MKYYCAWLSLLFCEKVFGKIIYRRLCAIRTLNKNIRKWKLIWSTSITKTAEEITRINFDFHKRFKNKENYARGNYYYYCDSECFLRRKQIIFFMKNMAIFSNNRSNRIGNLFTTHKIKLQKTSFRTLWPAQHISISQA